MMVLNPENDEEPNATGGKGSLYWNRQSGSCPNGNSDISTICNFEEIGLLPESQKLIGEAKWYLGTATGGNYQNEDNGAAKHWYSYERGETVYSSSVHPRKINWIGKVGLMYISDYGYATSGGATANREICLAKELYHWQSKDNGIPECKDNDWLFDSNKEQWTIVPLFGASDFEFRVRNDGYVGGYGVNNALGVRPVVYLSSSVKYKQGDGSSSNPFEFTLS